MQNIHPYFVHFPIALFVSSFLFELLSFFSKKEQFQTVSKWNWWLGTLLSVVTVGTGWWASNTVAHSDASHEIMKLHEKLGWTIFVGSIILSVWKLKAKAELEEKTKSFVLIFQTVLISVLVYSAHLGGKLVYEFGTGTSIQSESPTAKEAAPADSHDHSAHNHKHEHKVEKSDSKTGGYFCPMKCEGEKTYPKAGRCTVCGMSLVKK